MEPTKKSRLENEEKFNVQKAGTRKAAGKNPLKRYTTKKSRKNKESNGDDDHECSEEKG